MLSGRGLCDKPCPRLEKSYRLLCVILSHAESSRMKRPWPALGRCARKGEVELSSLLSALPVISTGTNCLATFHCCTITNHSHPHRSSLSCYTQSHSLPKYVYFSFLRLLLLKRNYIKYSEPRRKLEILHSRVHPVNIPSAFSNSSLILSFSFSSILSPPPISPVSFIQSFKDPYNTDASTS